MSASSSATHQSSLILDPKQRLAPLCQKGNRVSSSEEIHKVTANSYSYPQLSFAIPFTMLSLHRGTFTRQVNSRPSARPSEAGLNAETTPQLWRLLSAGLLIRPVNEPPFRSFSTCHGPESFLLWTWESTYTKSRSTTKERSLSWTQC